MPDSPPDVIANVDLTILSYQDLIDYRRDLITALENPGIEFEVVDNDTRDVYLARLEEVNAYLDQNFGEPSGDNEFSS